MSWINNCSRQRTLSGMHFSRKPLLAELATRRPERKSGALKCLKKICLCSEPGQCPVHPVPLCASDTEIHPQYMQGSRKMSKMLSNVHRYNACRATFVVFSCSAAREFDLSRPVCVLHASAHSMADALGNCFGRTVSADLWSDKAS
jgi:hypothetical protein